MAIPKHGPVAYEVDCVHHGGGVWPAQIVARVHTFYFLVYTLSQWCCRTASAVPRALDEDEDANSWAQGDDSIAQNMFIVHTSSVKNLSVRQTPANVSPGMRGLIKLKVTGISRYTRTPLVHCNTADIPRIVT